MKKLLAITLLLATFSIVSGQKPTTITVTSVSRVANSEVTWRRAKSLVSGQSHQICYTYDSTTKKFTTEGYGVKKFSFVWFQEKTRRKKIKRNYVNWDGQFHDTELGKFIAQLKVSTDTSEIRIVRGSSSIDQYLSFEIIQDGDTISYGQSMLFFYEDESYWHSENAKDVQNSSIDGFLYGILPPDFLFREKLTPTQPSK